MKTRSPDKPPGDAAEFSHAAYDEHVEALFRAMGRVRGKKAIALATLLYQAYAGVHFGFRPFEKRHEHLDPFEAAVCKALADSLMARSDRDPLGHKEIGVFFHS